ncbi:hypothetical protein HNQ93_002462 [Hymenobacter luteus]|uniref:Uncharacterized protein n=2 Tax=Hymenobacter TaxID=89966 RepID=A0A7W9WDE9_9BACT|nr:MULTISPECIES: DUF6266 family protein [Hymenobacter]MBB4601969.1 hypothetical protein [Hymenobacter latericoloratus]MBB6059602.1 hypothetical protein [Hymenobacter luteus]
MARIYSPLGNITGSLGNLTFSGGASGNQIRQKIASNNSNTPAQQNTRSRFKLLADLFRKFAGAAQMGLLSQGGKSAYNRFVQLNFINTTADAMHVASIDYSKLVLSGGSVEPLAGVGAVLDAQGGKVTVSFADNTNSNTALETDVVKAVVVNKATGRVVAASDEDVTRGDGSIVMEDDSLAGVQAANLMAFAFAHRADGSDASSTSQAQVAY